MKRETMEMLDDAIQKEIESLHKLEAGTDAHTRQTGDIAKLCEIALKDDKLQDDRDNELYRRGFESEKLESDRELKIKEMKEAGKRVLLGIAQVGGTALLYVASTHVEMSRVMQFETDGTIGSKAFALIPHFKPKLF